MRTALLVTIVNAALATACTDTAELRISPTEIDLVVDLADVASAPIELHVYRGDSDVTATSTMALTTPLGSIDAASFVSDGRTGGHGLIVVTVDGESVTIPTHVTIRSTRFVDVSEAVASWFTSSASAAVPYDALLEPGDGAVLPPNLGRIDVGFVVATGDDVSLVSIATPDLDVRIYGNTAKVTLTDAERDSLVRTVRGGAATLEVRTLSSEGAATPHVQTAQIEISDLPFAREILFTGRISDTDLPRMWSYELERASTEPWAYGPSGGCLGCHVAISHDKKTLAAGNNAGSVLVDVATHGIKVMPSPDVGLWQSAAFAPDGSLVTSQAGGVLSVRDGSTGVIRANLPSALFANQPAVTRDGASLVYVTGDYDPSMSQIQAHELKISAFSSMAGTLDAPRTLVAPAADGWFVKMPEVSPDDRWVTLSRNPTVMTTPGTILAVPLDGGPALELAEGFDFSRFASPIVAAPEAMTWIVMRSADRKLWAMAFYPERGVASRPFALPGQREDVMILHAPVVL